MFSSLSSQAIDGQFILTIAIAIAAAAAVLTFTMPLLETDTLGKRMKSVAVERDKIRQREREKLSQKQTKTTLRSESKPFMRQLVEDFDLKKYLGTEEAKMRLAMAGYRGPKAETSFLFARAVAPVVLLILTAIYIFLLMPVNWPIAAKIGLCLFASYLGIKVPEIFLGNTIAKRQMSMKRAFPDALDLLLICVESGMSIEHALRKVAYEIASQSVPMAEELHLTTAEMAYLPDRRTALENFALRTGLESVRQIVTVLIQAERYGTPLGQALRVVSQESRDMRMMEAEKKAASLPPKLTVPMIIFFLPVLFAVILTPAIIQIGAIWK